MVLVAFLNTKTTHPVLRTLRTRAPTAHHTRTLSRRCLRVCLVAQSFETATATAAASSEPLIRPADAAAAPAAGEPLTNSSSAEEEPVLQQAEVPRDVLLEFEHKLEADLQSVAVTLTAVTGVIIYWRGVWSLLDNLLGDSLFGDICCILVGLTIVLAIRLSGVKVASSFWPPS